MIEDPIVKEVRRIRDEHAASFDFDLDRIVDDLKRREKRRDATIVSFDATDADEQEERRRKSA